MQRGTTDGPVRTGPVGTGAAPTAPSVQTLRYFCAVIENGSFSAAARDLHMTQPPLSQAIAALEQRWNVQLFTRTSRDVRPLPAAQALYPEVLDILRRVDALPARAHAARSAQIRTPVRMGAVTSAFSRLVPEILTRASDLDMPLDLTLTDLPSAHIVEELTAGRLDAGLVRETSTTCVRAIPVVHDELRACVPAGHRLAARRSCRMADLAAEPLIVFDRTRASVSYDAIMAGFRLAGVTVAPIAHVSSESAAIALVRGGLGVTVVPRIAAADPTTGVRFLEIEDAQITYPLLLVVPHDDPRDLAAPLSALVRSALDALDTPDTPV